MRKHAGCPRVLAEMDFQFHLLLAEATRNELFGILLSPVIQQLHDHFLYAWEHYGERPVESVFAQHEAITAAVEAGDAELARRAMAHHIAFYVEHPASPRARFARPPTCPLATARPTTPTDRRHELKPCNLTQRSSAPPPSTGRNIHVSATSA